MGADAFVGRTAELDELRSAIDAARRGRGSLHLVVGDPGIGKTGLAEAAAAHASSARLSTCWASCWEGPTAPFWPWTQIVRSQLRAHPSADVPDEVLGLAGEVVDDRRPAHAEADSEAVRFALFDAVTRYLRTTAAQHPTLMVVDDLHWSDLGSIWLLEFFSREIRDAHVAVVATVRDLEVDLSTPVGDAISRVADKGNVIRLSGLADEEVSEILEETEGTRPTWDVAHSVRERTGGNPLFVRELARLLVAQRGLGSVSSLPIPEGVQGVIRRRLARLSQRCHDLLAVASVVGTEFRLDVLAEAAGKDTEEVLTRLDEAQGSRLAVGVPGSIGRFVFSHALVRDVLYAGVPLADRSKLHRRIGEAFERLADDGLEKHYVELAHHFGQAIETSGVTKALDYSVRAARRSIDQLAYEDAVGHYRRALEVLELQPDADRRQELLLELGEACLRAGDLPAARDVFAEAADVARRRNRAEDLARAALGFGAGLSGFEVQLADQLQLDLLSESLDRLDASDSALRAWALARLSVALSFRESVDRRREVAEEAVAMARRIDDRGALSYALSALCDAIAGPRDTERRLELTEEIVGIARRRGDRPMELLGRRLRVKAHLERGDLLSADAEIEAFAHVADSIHQPLYSWYVPLWRGMQSLLAGDFEKAMRMADEAESIGGRAHSVNAPMLSSVLRWMTALQRGRPMEAYELGRPMVELVSPIMTEWVHLFEALCSCADGRVDEARAWLPQLSPRIWDWPMDAEWLATVCQWSEVVAATGDEGAAAETYERLLPYRSRFGVEGIGAGLHGSVELHLGLLARTLGRRGEAEMHLRAALEAHKAIGAPILVERVEHELRELGQPTAEATRPAGNMFRHEGEFWTLGYDGSVVRMKHSKGLGDLATLLARPGEGVAALDLTGGAGSGGHAGEVLDERARAEYTARLRDLEEEIEEATALGESARVDRASAERDAIAHELAAAYGLGGRARRAKDPAERARTAVTRRIREAIARIGEAHPGLARHLRASVRTGTFCTYAPERPTSWDLTS